MIPLVSDRPNARLARILTLTSVFLVLGVALLIIPAVLPVFAAGVGIDQCANGKASDALNPQFCSWTNGILGNANSSYTEGMANPQRFLLSDLYGGSAGTQCDSTTHSCNLTFSASWTDGTNHGFDMLVSWDQAVTLNKQIAGVSDFLLEPCAGLNGSDPATCTSVYTTSRHIYDVSLPDDAFQSGSYQVNGSAQSRIDAFEGLYGNRTLRIYANDVITGASMLLSHCTNNLSACGLANGTDTSGQTVISYTLVFTTNATAAMVTFAGHYALSGNPRVNPLTWGYTNGSGAIGGASWHIKDPKLNYTGGSQDNQSQLFMGSAFPLDSGTVTTLHVGQGTAITDTVYISNTASGATDLAGNVHFYVCADTTDPYSPPASSALEFGCLSTTGGSGYTVTDVGTTNLTVVNAGKGKNSTAVSPIFTATVPGRYCFLTVFTPTDAIPHDYNVMSDTNGAGECVTFLHTTAVELSSITATTGHNWLLLGVTLGLLCVGGGAGVWWIRFKRN